MELLCLFMLMFTWSQSSAGPVEFRGGDCYDYKNRPVPHLTSYIPDTLAPCTSCICIHGMEEQCEKKELCPLPCSHYFTVADGNDCCQFLCSNGGSGPHNPPFNITNELLPTIIDTEDFSSLNTTNVGLRLVASTITSFLVLALLLFMIHRLRQRRLILMIRRLNGGQISNGGYGARRFSYEDDNLTGQNQTDLNFFEDPPPPYTFWKPPDNYFPQEEAPPPYDEAPAFLPQVPQQQQPRNSVLLSSFNPFISAVPEQSEGVTLQLNDLDAESADRRPRHSVPVQDLNVIESYSSLNSSRSDLNESHSLNTPATENVIRSDETYEDFHQHQLSSGTNVRSNLMGNNDTRPLKCHSCSDVVMSNWQATGAEKRRSLQQEWNLDGSETSSSSSPSFTRTLSPTSSDSSSIYHFETAMSNLGNFGNSANGSNNSSSVNCAASVKFSSVANGENSTNCASLGKLSSSGNCVGVLSSSNYTKCANSANCLCSAKFLGSNSAKFHGTAACATLLTYSDSSNPSNFSSSTKNLSCGHCASGSNSTKCQSSTVLLSNGCSCVGANGSRKRPSKLRQIFGTFNSSAKAKTRFQNGNRHSVAVSSGVREQIGVGMCLNLARTPRILYVSDGDISPHNQQRRLGSNSNSTAARKATKSRPHSYDFGNLVAAGGTDEAAAGTDIANFGTENRVNSFDSLTYTCSSSRASFDSEMLLQNSSTFHSQDGLTFSPEFETDTLRCSSTVAEPPSSPETTTAATATPNYSKWSQNKKNSKSSLKNYTEEDEAEEEPSEVTRIRLTFDSTKGSNESYI